MANYPYIGDHPAQPPEDDACPYCDGFKCTDEWIDGDWVTVPCEHCRDPED